MNTILKVDARQFIPFRKGNVLRNHQADFHLDDASLRIDVVSAFWPFMAEVTQVILEPVAFTEMQWLKRVATSIGFQELALGRYSPLHSHGHSAQAPRCSHCPIP